MENWIQVLATKAMRICRLNKEAAGNHRQDMTGPILTNLLNNGYTQVTWNSNGSHHSQCQDLDRQVWGLQNFLDTTEYDAPLFCRSHPGDNSCTLIVSGPNLSPVEVDSYGDTDTDIGTSRPVPVQKAPKQTVRPMPVVEPKIEQVPEKPEKKIVHVPKEVHKQIKNPFEKQDLNPEEYKQWLEDLEHEHVEESIPAENELTDEEWMDWLKQLEQKEEQEKRDKITDEEWDERRNFNKETSQKLPNWISGLFKDN